MSHLEDSLALQIRAAGLPEPQRQVRLVPGRRYAVDFYWEAANLAVEVEGGQWAYRHGQPMGHSTGSGLERDCMKANELTLVGIRLLRFTGDMVESGAALRLIERALEQARPVVVKSKGEA